MLKAIRYVVAILLIGLFSYIGLGAKRVAEYLARYTQ